MSVTLSVAYHPLARREKRAIIGDSQSRSLCREDGELAAETLSFIRAWERAGRPPAVSPPNQGYELWQGDGWSIRYLYTSRLGQYVAVHSEALFMLVLTLAVNERRTDDHSRRLAEARSRLEEYEV